MAQNPPLRPQTLFLEPVFLGCGWYVDIRLQTPGCLSIAAQAQFTFATLMVANEHLCLKASLSLAGKSMLLPGNAAMTGQQGAEALAPAVGKPLERVPTQTSDFTEDPSSPVDGRGEPLNLPQLDLTSSCQIWWDSAMCETLRLPSGYRKAAALLIKWCPSVCEFGQRGEQEMNQLKTVFEDSLNFETTIVPLTYDHHRSPELFLRDQVTKFLSKYNNPNDLLVVYVTSHASVHQEDQLLYLHP